MTDRNESIITKIRGLLALANDHKDDEECQTAFIMAQKLMIKYDISSSEVEDTREVDDIQEGDVTVFKTLFWWERKLARIISKNFKVKYFLWSKRFDGEKRTKRQIKFFGFENDVVLAKEMYILAYDVLTFYTKDFIEQHYESAGTKRSRAKTQRLKDSYIHGFLEGIEKKFEEQMQELEQEYGLVVLMPVQVANAYEDISKDFTMMKSNIPSIEESAAYEKGLHDGKRVDYTKSTIDEGE